MQANLRLGLLLALCAGTAGCGSNSSDPVANCEPRPVSTPGPNPNAPDYCQSLSSTFALKDRMGQTVDRFATGETITLESTVTNNSSESVTVTQPGCEHVHFDVYSTVGTPNIVWGSFDGRVCAAVVSEVTYAPGETKTFSSEWQQQLCDSSQAPAGDYRAQAMNGIGCHAQIDKELPLTLQ